MAGGKRSHLIPVVAEAVRTRLAADAAAAAGASPAAVAQNVSSSKANFREDPACTSLPANTASTAGLEIVELDASPTGKKRAATHSRSGREESSKRARGAVTRTRPSRQLLERLSRAFAHPIYLVSRFDSGREFHVMGASGSVYKVEIKPAPWCTCPDFEKRHVAGRGSRGPCKHILFVMNRVLKVDKLDPKLYQVSLLEEEVEEIFRNAPGATCSTLLADDAVVDKFRESQQDDDDDDDRECPVCFSEFDSAHRSVSCGSCRSIFHSDCMARVLEAAKTRGEALCPLCRKQWSDPERAENSLNLGAFSSKHRHGLTNEQLYPASHQFIGQSRGRGCGKELGRGPGRGGRGRGS